VLICIQIVRRPLDRFQLGIVAQLDQVLMLHHSPLGNGIQGKNLGHGVIEVTLGAFDRRNNCKSMIHRTILHSTVIGRLVVLVELNVKEQARRATTTTADILEEDRGQGLDHDPLVVVWMGATKENVPKNDRAIRTMEISGDV
jgi:hypothetical protein